MTKHIDTTSDTTQSATRCNGGQPRAKKFAYLSRFCNVQQRPENRCQRIVAPKVAGSSPVGHPSVFRIGKPETRNGKESRYEHRGLLKPLWHHSGFVREVGEGSRTLERV
jgi:hypothetical protein